MRKYKKAYVEITNICNKNCSFCHGTKRQPKFMNKAEFERVLDELDGVTEYLYFHVLGEPLCHPEVYNYINDAAKRGFKVTITTNGSLLENKLIQSGVYKIQISLHSFEEDDNYAKKEYIKTIIDFSKEAAKKGIIISLRLWNLGTDVSNDIIISEIKNAFPEPWIEGRSKSYTLSEKIYLGFANRFEWQDLNSPIINTSLFCYGLRDQIAILSNGTVVPCCLDAEGDIPLGNIFKTPLEEILNSKRAISIYEGFSKRIPCEELCKRCSYAKRFDI